MLPLLLRRPRSMLVDCHLLLEQGPRLLWEHYCRSLLVLSGSHRRSPRRQDAPQ